VARIGIVLIADQCDSHTHSQKAKRRHRPSAGAVVEMARGQRRSRHHYR
jgi:hypothetical protein